MQNKKEKGIILHIGTGDGKFSYELARKYKNRFIIGIDSSKENLKDISTRIYKKESKGGLANMLFINANIFDLPEELKGIANQIFINFPWGSLLKGIVTADELTWNNIKKVSKKGTLIEIIFGYDAQTDKTEIERLGLPEMNLNYLKTILLPELKLKGFEIKQLSEITSDNFKKFPSSWAKKMSFGKVRKYYYLKIETK